MKINSPYKYNNGYIYLSVAADGVDIESTIQVSDEKLYRKSEFHISLVCVRDLLVQFPSVTEAQVVSFFNRFTGGKDLSQFSYVPEQRIAKHPDGRMSLIQMVVVPGLKDFFDELNDRFDISVDTQPTHITLYTRQKNNGIGINNNTQLHNTRLFIENRL